METREPISRDEASAALALTEHSRARVAWAGYPAWYWLLSGAGLGAVAYLIMSPGNWDLLGAAAVAVLLIGVTRAASRARGICEGHFRSAMTLREKLLLSGPAALVMVAGAFASKFAGWVPAVAATTVFALYAGTGLAMGARADRR